MIIKFKNFVITIIILEYNI